MAYWSYMCDISRALETNWEFHLNCTELYRPLRPLTETVVSCKHQVVRD